VPVNKDFPLGVKTTYSAYASDNLVEIIEDPKCDIKLRAVSVKVTTFPTAKSNKSEVGGLFVLQNYPKCRLLPFTFPNPKSKDTNLRQPIIRAAKAIHKVYNVVKAEISEQWAEFEKNFPEEGETVEQFIERYLTKSYKNNIMLKLLKFYFFV
jgi:hypothetical protein